MDIKEKRRQEARKVMGGILGNNTSVMQKPSSEQDKRRQEARNIIDSTLSKNNAKPASKVNVTSSSPESPYSKYTNSKDFREYAQKGAAIQNPTSQGININGIPLIPKKLNNKVMYSRGDNFDKTASGANIKYSKMTQEEVDVYNYLLAKSGNMKGGDFLAEEFLKSIDSELNKRTMQGMTKDVKNIASENKLAGVGLNMMSSLFKGAGAVKTASQSVENLLTGKNQKTDPNDPLFMFTAMEQASREGIKDEMGSVGSFLTDTGLSMGQTLIRLPMGVAGLPLAGLGAASQTSRDVLERGGSQNQAMLVGSLAGAAEIVFEKISLDNLKAFKHNPAKNSKGLIKNILKGAGVEGTEEVLTEITNGIFDRVLMKDLSQHELRIASYKAQGITDQKAKQMANMEFAKEIGLSFLGGALSGGVMGTGANVLGNYQQGKMVQDTNSTQALIDEGLASEPNTTAYKNAVANQEMLNKGKKVSNTELGYQINANQEAINQEELADKTTSNQSFSEVPAMQPQIPQNPQITRLQGESEAYNNEGKSAFVNGYDGRLDIDTYKKGFDRFYNNGKTNLSLEWTEQQSAFTPLLSPETRKNAWLSGQKYAQDIATEQHAKLVPIKEKGGFDNIDNMSLLDDAEASVIHYIANATGVKVVAHEDIEGMNGYYENGTIHISSKADNKPLVVFSHELTHHLEDTSPTAWKDYKDYVINYMKTDHAEKFNSLYSHTENLYREHGLDITDDLITNEIVANATEEFLTDGKSIERLIQQDRNLAQKIFDAIERFIEVIKETFTGYTANTHEGKLMRENLEVLEQSKKLWFDALENAQAVKRNNSSEKFSIKDTSDVDMKRLTAENEKLKETNAVLKQQFKLTKGYVPKESALRTLANSIKKEYSSSYDTNTLVSNLKGLVEHINNSNTMQWDDVMEATVGMAKKIVESSSVLNNTLYDQYSDLRNTLRNTAINLSDDAKTEIGYHYDSYENFRRKNFGRLKLTNEGISLDSLWGELSDQYPEVFSADTNDLEQALVVSQFLDSIKPFYENPYGMDMDAVAYDLALDLYKQYFDMPGVVTYADRQAMKLRKVKNDYEERIQSIRDDYKERYENRLSEIKSKHKDHLSAKNDLLDKQRAKHKEVMAQSKATVKEKGLIKKYRTRIEKNTKDLTTWLLRPTDAKHVPEKLKRTVTEFLSTLDFSSTRLNNLGEPTRKTLRWQDTMNALRNAMVDMDNEGNSDFYMDIDPDFHDRLSAFVDTNNKYESIYSMNSTQLQEVDYLVSVTKKAVTEANKLHANKRYSSIVELGNSTISDLDKKKKKAMQSEVVRKIDNFLSYDQMDSFSFADTLGDAGKSVIQSLRDGQDRHTVNVKQAVDFMENLTDGIKIKNWTGRNALVNTFDINGQEVKMTVGQIMELYLLNKREQARGHIYGGGIKVLDVIGKEDGKKVKLKYEQPINLSQFDVETIISSLTDEQIKVADGMQKFLGEDVAKWGNETTVEMYGYKKFTEKNYYPIKSDDNYTATSDKNNSTNGQMYAIKNLGMTKGTAKNANNPIYIGDVFDTFSSHVNEMSTYNAFMIPISDAMKWYNYKNVITGLDGKKIFNSVKSSLERTGGKASKDYFVNLIKDINGVSKMAQSTEWYKGITSNFKVAAVGGNLRVAIQQPTAYFRAYALIDSKYLAMGPSKLPPVKRMQKYAPIAQWKNWGFFETNVGRSMKSIIVDEYSMTESVREKSLWLAGKADDITWGFLWNAVEFETKAKHKNLQVGSEEFYQEVGKRFTEVVDRTQVVDTVFHRSQMMRSKDGYLKMITSFMSEPNKSFNMLRNALMNYTNKPTSEHIKLIYRATMAWGVSSIATSMASAVMDALRSREKEREFKEKWGDAAWANFWDNINPANLLPFTRDIMSLMGKYNPSRIDMTAISNLRLSGEEIYKLYNGESKKSPYAVTSQTIKAASQFLGIPAGNILREVEGVINTILKDGIEWENETANAKKAYGNIYNSLMSGKKEDYERIYKKMYNKYTDEAKGKGKPYDKDTISKKIEDNIRDILIEDENVIRVANDRINGISYTTSNLVLEYEIKGFSKDTVISAINATYEKIKKEKKKAENPTETKKEKPLSSYSYSDLHAAIETGNDKSIEEIRDHLLEKEWEFKNIKSSVTGKMKPVYIEYYEQGNTKAMNELGNRLIKYFGYEQDDLDDWIPGRGYKDLGQAIIDGDSKKLVEIREYYLENGKNISSIRSGVTRYIKPLYLEYYQKGNTRKMEQLKTDLIDYFGYNSNTIDKWIK